MTIVQDDLFDAVLMARRPGGRRCEGSCASCWARPRRIGGRRDGPRHSRSGRRAGRNAQDGIPRRGRLFRLLRVRRVFSLTFL